MPCDRPQILCAVTSDEVATAVVLTALRVAEDGRYDVRFLHVTGPGRGTVPVDASAYAGYSRDLMIAQAARGRTRC